MKTSTKNYRDALEGMRKQLLASRFMRWWLGELSSMVPAWMQSAELSAASFLLVPLGQIDAKRSLIESETQRAVALTLPPQSVLRKTLTLPLATEENLRQVLEFQMEQHTPFPAGQLYFGHRVLARDFERGQLRVEFVATPRATVDAAVKTLAEQGVGVRAVFAEDMLAAGSLVNLLPLALGKAPSALRSGANLWLALLVGLLALTAMAVPILVKREAVVQMLPWVDKGKKAAETVDGIRRELEARVDQHNYLLEKRQATPTVIQTLEELTRVLPDDTWVQTLDIKGKELQIQGETASSVKLIGLFEHSSIFRDASFRSALTVGQASKTERYQLALQIGPIAAAASAPIAAASSEKKP
nr:PilN domain-containing protein [Rhodoferax sp.]